MAVETDASGTKYIKWTTPSGLIGLTAKSLLLWVYPDDFGGGYGVFLISDGVGAGSNELNGLTTQITTGKVQWNAHFSGTNGTWITTSATLTAGAWNMVTLTYDGSATTNDPVIYINGVSASLTESSTPVGTYKSGTSADLYVGTAASGANIDGLISSCLMFNRVLSASEIADAYASKLAIPTWRGLVFAPQLWSRGEVGEGGTLTASHTIADAVSGALGTPSGSPLHRQDAYLTYSGVS